MNDTTTPIHAPATTVAQVMHEGVIRCPAHAPLSEVARMMASHRVHCVAVYDEVAESGPDTPVWGVVSDLDLAGAIAAGKLDGHARRAACTPVVTTTPGEGLERAAQLMAENETAHLVVVDPVSGHPVGVVSTLDLARYAAEVAP